MLLNLSILSNFLCEVSKDDSATAGWIASSFPIIKAVIVAIIGLLAIAMIIIFLLQRTGESNGMSALSGKSETFYNKNKGATLQGKMKIATIVIAVLILVLCIVFLILNMIFQGWL